MPEIRIATFNVFYGQNPKRFSDAILQNENLAKADIILLQEVESYPEEGKGRAEYIAEDLQMNCVYTPARDTPIGGGTHGLAILSRFPIKETEVVPLQFFRLGRNSRKRIAVNSIVDIDGTLIQVANVHLDTTLNFGARVKQAKAIVEHQKQNHIKKAVLAGDFNTTPFIFLLRLIPIFYSDQRSKFYRYLNANGFYTKLDKIGHTMRRRVFKFSLDSIFVRDLEIINFGIERSVSVSDHHPVWVDVLL